MRRPCEEIHPIAVPAVCPICAAYTAAKNQAPGRLPVDRPPNLLGANGGGDRCATPEGADDAEFLESPEQINVCDSGSGSGSGGGTCEFPQAASCGVSGVYCQGNLLMVMYSTPIRPPIGTLFCTEVTWSLNCEGFPLGAKYCADWETGHVSGDKRLLLCPGGYGVYEETATGDPYDTIAQCEAGCPSTLTSTTTTASP